MRINESTSADLTENEVLNDDNSEILLNAKIVEPKRIILLFLLFVFKLKLRQMFFLFN